MLRNYKLDWLTILDISFISYLNLNTPQINMLRLSLIVCLLSAGALAQVQLQDYQYAAPRFNFDEDGTLYNRIKSFFDFTNSGQTTLGKILAWKGDLIQPAALFGLSVFAVYTLIR